MDKIAQPRVVVFDVNETLLDLGGLSVVFGDVLGVEFMPLWFSKMLHGSLVASITGVYLPFDELGTYALMAVGAATGVEIPVEKARSVVAGMEDLHPHSDVVPSLELLRDAGFRLATLTNSSSDVLERQMLNSGLAPFFEQMISVEQLGVFKPFTETYRYGAEKLGVGIEDVLLVAAHDWDVAGARHAGARAAFLGRDRASMSPHIDTADIVGPDLITIAKSIINS